MKNLIYIFVGVALTTLSYLVCLWAGVDIQFNWLEFMAVSTSYTCTILFALQKRIAYFYGVISTFFLCVFFGLQGVFALAIFNGILVASLIYGYFRWGPDGNPIPVTRIDNIKSLSGYALFFCVVAAGFYLIVGGTLNIDFILSPKIEMILALQIDPLLVSKIDLLLASGSAMAQLMLDNKKIENWLVWIVINIFSIGFFINQGFFLLAIQFAMFLLNAIVAFVHWKKDLKGEIKCKA